MKKLFTLLAFLTCFLGAKAEWVTDYEIDYSKYQGFPFYVMGYVPEWFDGVMTDLGANYRYAKQADLDGDGDAKWKDGETSEATVNTNDGTEYQKVTGAGPYWHQYFIADNIKTELDGSYTVKALVKASEAVTINVNMGWGWGSGEQASASVNIPASDDFQEVEWEYTGIGGTSCNLVAQPGSSTATIEWKSLTVSHNQKEQRPVTWQEWLSNDGKAIIPGVETESKYVGDAETAWPEWSLEKTDGTNINWRTDRAPEICAWSLTMGKNNDAGTRDGEALDGRARPYPADIEEEAGNASNHVFAVHVDQIDIIDDDNSIQWSNQFWLQAPKAFKAGDQVRIKFRYKAEHACSVATQWHKKNPSDYLNWTGVGSISFTTEWQEYDNVATLDTDGTWSLAFNLTSDSKKDAPQDLNVFYFDDLCWQTMNLDEGYFVAGSNANKGLEYDFDNAIEFEKDGDLLVATVGTAGKEDSWVNEVMISTVRGNDAAFKSNTLKPSGTVADGEWLDYAAGSLAKIKLPAAGVWTISIDTESSIMKFDEVEGDQPVVQEPVDIVTNAEVIVVNAGERSAEGNVWDNQFFVTANRVLDAGEVTVVEFDYVATKEAKVSSQSHATPGAYRGNAIGDVNFTTEEQHFKAEFTIPKNDNADIQTIAFNLAEIVEANDYTFKNFKWYLKYETEGKTLENLINETGTDNFSWNVIDPSGIINVKEDAVKASSAIYNLAGQRVSKDYKGIVVKDGKKFVVK